MGPGKENGQLMIKRPELPDGFQVSVFKGKGRERVRVPNQLVDV